MNTLPYFSTVLLGCGILGAYIGSIIGCIEGFKQTKHQRLYDSHYPCDVIELAMVYGLAAGLAGLCLPITLPSYIYYHLNH